MKRILSALLLIIVCICLLVACNGKNKNKADSNAPGSDSSENQGGTADKEEKPVDHDVVWSPDVSISIIYTLGGVSEDHLSDILYTAGANAKDVMVYTDIAPKAEHEIVIGKTGRDISIAAYRALERLEAEGEEYVGYCIYSDGKSIAIAYDEEFLGTNHAEDVAISTFVEKYSSTAVLKLEKGVQDGERFSAIEYQQELDQKELDVAWAEVERTIAAKYGEELAAKSVAALKNCYGIYTDDMISWFANLYDPVIGGYYFSNSARNTEGYLPDLESTNQALGFIVSSGMGNVKDVIPKEMQKQIVNFVRSLQSGENGHFYHPQWGKELTDKYPSRKGRDLQNAARILEYFDSKPIYDMPNGVKGENPIGTVLPASANMTESLNNSVAIMVSKVILANDADAGVESYLLNDVNFKAYLEKYRSKMATDSYWVGNEMESISTQVANRDKVLKDRGVDYSLATIMTDWLTSFQDPETGLWEPYEGNEYACVNGILKISSAYNKVGKYVPNAEKLLRYAIMAVTSEADPHHVCCVLNTWYAMTILTSNINSYGGSGEKAAVKELTDEFAESYPEMVETTMKKFSLFVKTEGSSKGGFSYFQKKTSETSQGLPVALENQNEADVNSSYICSSGVMGHIFGFMGASAIDIYTKSDAMKYRLILESLDEIIKDKEVKPVPIDLEDVENTQELMNDGILDMWLPKGELAIEDGYSIDGASRVMRLTTIPGGTDLFQILMTKSQGAYNSIAYQTDMMISPDATTNYTLLFFGSQSTVKAANMQIIAIPDDGVYVSVIDSDEKIKIADTDKWFTLRVEYARLTYSKIILDIFVNDKFITSSAVPCGEESISASSVKRIQFASDSNGAGSAYFDNFFLEQFLKELPAGVEEDEGPSEAETRTATFESKPLGAYYSQKWLDRWLPAGSLEIVDATPYGTESKVLALTTEGDNDDLFQFFITKTEESYNAVGIQTDVMFDAEPGSKFRLLIFGNSSSRGYDMIMSVENDGVYVSGPGMTKTRIAARGEWFNLQYGYAKLSANKIYVAVIVNNSLVAQSTVPLDMSAVPEVKDIQRVQFSSDHESFATGTVYFDNMIMAQLTYALPEAPSEPEPDPDTPVTPSDPTVETYEDNDAIDTFKFNNWNGGDSAANTSWYDIVSGEPYGKKSKVYGYETVSGYKPEVTFQITPDSSASFASFESDMMLTTSGYLRPEFQLRTAGNGLIFTFYIEAKDGKVKLLDSSKEYIATLADDGEWFKFGVKASDYEGGLVITFYLNGERIKTGFKYTAEGVANTVGRVRFWTETTDLGFIYFDNTKILSAIGELDEIDPDEVTTPDPDPKPEPKPESSTLETYEDGDSISVFEFDNWNGGDAAENTSWYGITDAAPYGESSKVYGYKTVAGYKPEVSFKFSSSPEANYTFFESDMMLTTDGNLCPEFQLRTAGNIQLFKFYLKSDGEKVYLLDGDSNRLAELAKDGEWFRFGVKGSDYQGGLAITYYLNGERLDTELYKTGGNAYAFERLRFWTETSNVGEIYFDNTEITCSKETFTPPASDGSDDSDNPYDGDTNVGDSDWT